VEQLCENQRTLKEIELFYIFICLTVIIVGVLPQVLSNLITAPVTLEPQVPVVITSKKKKTVTKKPKTAPKPKPKTTPKPKVQFANSWEDDIILDAVDKLVKMGHKRSRSRMIVSRLCSSKSYERTEDIILDAMKKCV